MSTLFEKLFYQALRIRLVEEEIVRIYPTDKIQSPVHLSIGQEHHTAAIMSALRVEDQVFTTYRSHAAYIAKGGGLREMFAELYGKKTGMSQGKAGSMHLCAPDVNMMGSSAIVGATLSHAMGAAYAMLLRSKHSIVVSLTGDGSTEEGVFAECLNFSSLKNIPVLYVIENNGLAIHSPKYKRQSYSLKDIARSYSIPFFYCEKGADMTGVYKTTRSIAERMRRKPGPAIFEIVTFRQMEHVGVSQDFDKGYRSRRELESCLKSDPLVRNAALIEKYKPGILREIATAVRFAENSPFAETDCLLKDVR